jgi:hypothetical protein
VACLSLSAAAQPSSRTRRITTFPIAVTVTEDEGEPVVDDAWIAIEVENANAIFRDHGVGFRVVDRHRADSTHARMETRHDRHSLGRLMHAQRIDLFAVRSLRDVDDPSRYRQGVHWRPRGVGARDGAHFVIISSIAGPTVLAHELGHYFGNPHSDTPGNIMSYERGEVPPFFDDVQSVRIRASAQRFLRERELVAASATD